MDFTYKQIKRCIKNLGTLELYDLESKIIKEFRKRKFDKDNLKKVKKENKNG